MKSKGKPLTLYFCDGTCYLSKYVRRINFLGPDFHVVNGTMKVAGAQSTAYLLVILVVWNIGCVFRRGFRGTSSIIVQGLNSDRGQEIFLLPETTRAALGTEIVSRRWIGRSVNFTADLHLTIRLRMTGDKPQPRLRLHGVQSKNFKVEPSKRRKLLN